MDPDVILEYREETERGVKLPPIDVFTGGYTYWLADGFHRLFASIELERKSIKAVVHRGSLRAAIVFSFVANEKHSLPRSNDDRRQAVERMLKDDEWPKWSDRRIAKQCEVSPEFVHKIHKRLSANGRQTGKQVIRGNTEYTMDTANIGRPGGTIAEMTQHEEDDNEAAEESAATCIAPVGAGDFFPWNRGVAAVSTREPDRRSGPLRAVAVVPEPSLWPTRSSHSARRRRRVDRLSPPPQHRSQTQPHTNETKYSAAIRNRRRPNQVMLGE
jgi:hypothetical protein